MMGSQVAERHRQARRRRDLHQLIEAIDITRSEIVVAGPEVRIVYIYGKLRDDTEEKTTAGAPSGDWAAALRRAGRA